MMRGKQHARRARRCPAFTLSREEVFRRCKAKGHRLVCAAEALALRDVMERLGWTALELAEHSGVSRQMIGAILNLDRVPTSEVLDQLARTCGMRLWEFDLLAEFEAQGEVPLWWHGS